MREQHGFLGTLPMLRLMRPLRTLAHTPSFRVSTGHLPLDDRLGVAGVGQLPQALAKAKKRRLSARKRAAEVVVLLVAMAS